MVKSVLEPIPDTSSIIPAAVRTPRRVGTGQLGTGHVLVVAIALAAVPLLWFGFEGLVREWGKPHFRLHWLVPIFSTFLFLKTMRAASPKQTQDWTRWFGVLTIGASLLVALVGNRLAMDDLVFAAIILWPAGLIVTCFGLRGALVFWAPLGSLLLLVPPNLFLISPIQRAMELVGARLASTFLNIAELPVRLEGQMLYVASYQIEIREAAAGSENLFPLILISVFFLALYRGPLWSRITPLMLAAPVVVLVASGRIVAIALAFVAGGEEAVSRVLAVWDEWLFLFACLGLMLPAAFAVRRCTRGQDNPQHRKPAAGGKAETVQVFLGRANPPLLTATAVSVGVSAVFLLMPDPVAAKVEREPFSQFPPDIGAWTGSSLAIDPGVAEVLKADDYVNIDFHNPEEAASVNFWVAYYAVQKGDKYGIHSPQVCLPGEGWNILSFRQLEIGGQDKDAVEVNRVLMERSGRRSLVYYWFEGRGRRTTHELSARILLKVDDLLKARTDGALVRYVTMIQPNETERAADKRLQRFVSDTIALLPRYVPK